MALTLLSSCSSDSSEEGSDKNVMNNSYVGYWEIPHIDVGLNNYPSYYMLLYKEGLMKGGSNLKNDDFIKTYKWKFDKSSNNLITTAIQNRHNLQWNITMKENNSWTGLALWDMTSSNKTCVASKKVDSALLYLILSRKKWIGGYEDGQLTLSNVSMSSNNAEADVRISSNSTISVYNHIHGVGGSTYKLNGSEFSYNPSRDILIKEFEESHRDQNNQEIGKIHYRFAIVHPFSYYDVKLNVAFSSEYYNEPYKSYYPTGTYDITLYPVD